MRHLLSKLSSCVVWQAVAPSAAPICMAAISPSAVRCVHSLFSAWYSSVRRGANIVRKMGLPALPPVATTTPLRARLFMVRAALRTHVRHDTRTAGGAGHFVRPRHDIQPRAHAIEAIGLGAIAFPLDAVL